MRFGVTGHQGLSQPTEALLTVELRKLLRPHPRLVGVSSLANGADQVFARTVLSLSGTLEAVIPASRYHETFPVGEKRAEYQRLLSLAARKIVLDFEEPSEEAFMAAGKEVVARSDELVAVWDGRRARGFGGTADIVAFARETDVPVHIVWPAGSARERPVPA